MSPLSSGVAQRIHFTGAVHGKRADVQKCVESVGVTDDNPDTEPMVQWVETAQIATCFDISHHKLQEMNRAGRLIAG
jgi:hypothetical protein